MPLDGHDAHPLDASRERSGDARRALEVPPLLAAAMRQPTVAAQRDLRTAQLAERVANDIRSYAVQWDRRTVTQPIAHQFWITVPVVGAAPPILGSDGDGRMCVVDALWRGLPAPDGTRIASATALVGDVDSARYLMLLFDVDERALERQLSAELLTARLRASLELASGTIDTPEQIL